MIKSIFRINILVALGVLLTIVVTVFFSQFGSAAPQVLKKVSTDSPNSINQVDPKSEKDSYKLIFGGDVMLARKVGIEIITRNFDPFSALGDTLRAADLAIVNLECVVSDKGSQTVGKYYTFRADPRTLKVLQNAGIDMVSIANNHSGDFGTVAFSDMLQRLTTSSIGYFGGGKNATEAYSPKYVFVGRLKLAFLGFSNIETPYFTATDTKAGIAWFKDDKVIAAITEAKQNADLVFIVPHWGTEYTDKLNNEQQRFMVGQYLRNHV